MAAFSTESLLKQKSCKDLMVLRVTCFSQHLLLLAPLPAFFENLVVLRVTCFSQFVCLCATITNLPKPKIWYQLIMFVVTSDMFQKNCESIITSATCKHLLSQGKLLVFKNKSYGATYWLCFNECLLSVTHATLPASWNQMFIGFYAISISTTSFWKFEF